MLIPGRPAGCCQFVQQGAHPLSPLGYLPYLTIPHHTTPNSSKKKQAPPQMGWPGPARFSQIYTFSCSKPKRTNYPANKAAPLACSKSVRVEVGAVWPISDAGNPPPLTPATWRRVRPLPSVYRPRPFSPSSSAPAQRHPHPARMPGKTPPQPRRGCGRRSNRGCVLVCQDGHNSRPRAMSGPKSILTDGSSGSVRRICSMSAAPTNCGACTPFTEYVMPSRGS